VDGKGNARVVQRYPRLAWDEVAFPLTVKLPETWGRVYGDVPIEVQMPDPDGPPTVKVGEAS
jgi:hypothetical protein